VKNSNNVYTVHNCVTDAGTVITTAKIAMQIEHKIANKTAKKCTNILICRLQRMRDSAFNCYVISGMEMNE